MDTSFTMAAAFIDIRTAGLFMLIMRLIMQIGLVLLFAVQAMIVPPLCHSVHPHFRTAIKIYMGISKLKIHSVMLISIKRLL
jgi:hypothetical protein